jgi:hypothetical protein
MNILVRTQGRQGRQLAASMTLPLPTKSLTPSGKGQKTALCERFQNDILPDTVAAE